MAFDAETLRMGRAVTAERAAAKPAVPAAATATRYVAVASSRPFARATRAGVPAGIAHLADFRFGYLPTTF